MPQEMPQESPEETKRRDRHLVVGLGNPGSRYRNTRHNVGFRVVERLAGRWHADFHEEVCSALLADAGLADLATPQTFMNRSGWSVRCLVERFGYPTARVLVVLDEVALPLGTLRLRAKGSPAGHRGLESVIENLRTDEIPRLRIGIAPVREDGRQCDEIDGELSDFVLSDFDPDEVELVDRVVERAADAAVSWIERGLQTTMNEFNGEVIASGA